MNFLHSLNHDQVLLLIVAVTVLLTRPVVISLPKVVEISFRSVLEILAVLVKAIAIDLRTVTKLMFAKEIVGNQDKATRNVGKIKVRPHYRVRFNGAKA